MSHDQQLLRQWSLLKLLSARKYGATVDDMAKETGVDARTIRRYLKMFQNVGFPLSATKHAHGLKKWELKSASTGAPEISFTFEEAIALWLGRRFLEPLAGTPIWSAAQQAFKKVRACLPNNALSYLDMMAGRLHYTGLAGDYSDKAELVDQLMQGIEDCRVTFINYQSLSATEPVQYELEPLGMVYHRGAIYLVAQSRQHGEVRHFKVNRITEVNVEQFKFDRPPDFDLAGHFAGSFGVYQGKEDVRVEVRFLPPVVRYVTENRWHASQQNEPQSDGSLVASFQLSTVEEFKRWLLSFGRNVEVLQPESLREEIRSEAEALARMHERPAAPRSAKVSSNGRPATSAAAPARKAGGTGRAVGPKTRKAASARTTRMRRPR